MYDRRPDMSVCLAVKDLPLPRFAAPKNEQEARHASVYPDQDNQTPYSNLIPRPPGRVPTKKLSTHEVIQPCVPAADPQVSRPALTSLTPPPPPEPGFRLLSSSRFVCSRTRRLLSCRLTNLRRPRLTRGESTSARPAGAPSSGRRARLVPRGPCSETHNQVNTDHRQSYDHYLRPLVYNVPTQPSYLSWPGICSTVHLYIRSLYHD